MVAHPRPRAVAEQLRRQPGVNLRDVGGQRQDAVAAFEDATDVINRPGGGHRPPTTFQAQALLRKRFGIDLADVGIAADHGL